MDDELPTIQMNGGIAELFYVLDFGDYLSTGLESLVSRNLAHSIGHTICWGVNLALWSSGIALALKYSKRIK